MQSLLSPPSPPSPEIHIVVSVPKGKHNLLTIHNSRLLLSVRPFLLLLELLAGSVLLWITSVGSNMDQSGHISSGGMFSNDFFFSLFLIFYQFFLNIFFFSLLLYFVLFGFLSIFISF